VNVGEHNNDAQAIISAVERLDKAELVSVARGTPDACAVLVAPTGKTVHDLKPLLDKYLPRPERKKGTATLTTLLAFNAYTQRHMTGDSAVFVDDTEKSKPRIVAVFNAAHKEPDHQDHRAVYAFPLSDEWVAWSKLPEWFTQAEFAAFIEDRILDVMDPAKAGAVAKELAESVGTTLASPSKLLELSRGLAVNVDAKVAQSVRLDSGEGQITFKEEHKDENGAPIKFPGAFCLAIPVFRLGISYSVPVRLRYRVSSGRVVWQLALQRVEQVFESAIAEAARSVEDVTSLPVFRGKPE
jgi:hypothetical protein